MCRHLQVYQPTCDCADKGGVPAVPLAILCAVMPAASTPAQRVAKRRAALRAQGLRLAQIWVPDSRAPGFAEECARQAAIVNKANRVDADLTQFTDSAAQDLNEHLEGLEVEHRT